MIKAIFVLDEPTQQMLKNGTLYPELGASHFDNRAKDKQAMRLTSRLKKLGFEIQIKLRAA